MPKMNLFLIALALAALAPQARAELNEDHQLQEPVLSWWSLPFCGPAVEPKVMCSEDNKFGYVCLQAKVMIIGTTRWKWQRIPDDQILNYCK